MADSALRLTQILYSGLGGHSSVAFSLAQGDRSGRLSHSLLFFGVGPTFEPSLRKSAALGIETESVRFRRRHALAAARDTYAALQRLAPDFVIAHSPASVLPAFWYCRRRGSLLLVVEHQANDAKTWKHHLWSRIALRCADLVVVLTDGYRDEYLKLHGGRLGGRVGVIGNGIDTDFFRAGTRRRTGVGRRIGMASRLTKLRDHIGLLHAVAQLDDPELTLSIAGGGGQEAEIRAEAARLGVLDHVEFLGALDEADVADFLRSLDVYVHASWHETMSTAIMQAMATGLPVVAYDVPGIRNMIVDGVTGVLTPPGDRYELAQTIRGLVVDPGRREALGNSARAYAVAHWAQDVMFEKYLRAIEGLLP